MIEFSGYHGGVNNERNGLVDIEKVVEKWSGFLRHGDMGMVAKDDKWGERYGYDATASLIYKHVHDNFDGL